MQYSFTTKQENQCPIKILRGSPGAPLTDKEGLGSGFLFSCILKHQSISWQNWATGTGWDVAEDTGDQHTLLGHRPTHRENEYPVFKSLLKVSVVATFLIHTQPQYAVKQPLAEALPFLSWMMHQSLSSRHPPSPGAAPQPSLSDSTSPLLHSWHLPQFPRH